MSNPVEKMPTTKEALRAAEIALSPLLRDDFYGRVTLIYEHGKSVRVEILESHKLS